MCQTPHGLPDELFGGLERGRLDARDRHGLELLWVPDSPGHFGAEVGEAALDVAPAAVLDRIVGCTVGGLDVDREPFAAIFVRARDAGLHCIPHAGEAGDPSRVWSALRALGAERIGHGIRSIEDPALVEHLAASGVPLDACPTSNLRTRVVDDLERHPLPRLLERGVVCTLSTDDPTMFGTDLIGGYRTGAAMGLPPATLVELARHGVRASDADEALRTAPLDEIDLVENEYAPR